MLYGLSGGDVGLVKASMLREIQESEFDMDMGTLLVGVVETYFDLDDEQKEELRRILTRTELRTTRDIETYFDELQERGRQRGLKEGREKGKRETLLRQLTSKFGPVPESVILRVNALRSESELDSYLERLLTARSLEELGL